MYKLHLCLVVLSSLIIAYAEVLKCNRQVDLLDNYDSSKIKGTWYVVETSEESKSKKKCMTSTITDEKGTLDNSILLKETGLVDGKDEELDVSLAQIESASKYVAQIPELPTINVWMVGTDHATYAAWFLCNNGDKQDGIIHVATRDRKPSEETLKKAHEALEKAGFKTGESYLLPVDHSNC